MVRGGVYTQGPDGKDVKYVFKHRSAEMSSPSSSRTNYRFNLQRGGALIKKWGRSSAASTSVSIVDAIKSLVNPTPEGDWFSSGVSPCLYVNTLYTVCLQ